MFHSVLLVIPISVVVGLSKRGVLSAKMEYDSRGIVPVRANIVCNPRDQAHRQSRNGINCCEITRLDLYRG
jgi:hypothetical protein